MLKNNPKPTPFPLFESAPRHFLTFSEIIENQPLSPLFYHLFKEATMSHDISKIENVSDLTGIDINMAVAEAQAVGRLFEKMGIKEATLHNGNYFNQNLETNTKTVATEGCIVQEHENTVTVILKKTNAMPTSAISEINSQTQKALGAFAGKSQPWISKNRD
jgi:hypothetical protein